MAIVPANALARRYRDVLGRVNATMRFVMWSTIPLGSLCGSVISTFIGARLTLVVGALGMFLAALMLACSPVRNLREQPRGTPEGRLASVTE